MYKKGIYKILTNEPLTDAVWRMTLAGDTQWISAPGQFVNIALEGKYLRRPISICDYDNRSIALIYKVVGGGTEQMSRMLPGETLDLLTGLGNGFSTKNNARRPLLVGGGVGVPPLYNLAKRLLAEYPDMPHYAAPEGRVKLAAGWLIDRAGMKGYREGSVGVHERQALVLVNHGGATGGEVIAFARTVQAKVREKFGIEIDTEVNIL